MWNNIILSRALTMIFIFFEGGGVRNVLRYSIKGTQSADVDAH